jgi:hypothetical protein
MCKYFSLYYKKLYHNKLKHYFYDNSKYADEGRESVKNALAGSDGI